MQTLYNIKPTRLFTFGCSFTSWYWATWANILAFDLDCEFYNFGKQGAGNFYISNLITQVDSIYKFNSTDLIVISWTNISREDRWIENQAWLTPGNIYSQNHYDKNFVKRYANDTHFSLRDFSLISLIDNYLSQKCQYHFLSMCDITKRTDQWSDINKKNKIIDIVNIYSSCLNKIKPSFYDILWNNNIENKFKKNKIEIHPNYLDGHPTLLEHCYYLEQTFNNCLTTKTKDIAASAYQEWLEYIKKYFENHSKVNYTWDLPHEVQKNLRNISILKESNNKSKLIFE